MKVPDRPHVVWRAYAFRSRGFFRASRAGDAMRARAHPRVRGRAAMRARFPQHARIRRPTRASRARWRRPRAPRPPGPPAPVWHARGAQKEIFPSVATGPKAPREIRRVREWFRFLSRLRFFSRFFEKKATDPLAYARAFYGKPPLFFASRRSASRATTARSPA